MLHQSLVRNYPLTVRTTHISAVRPIRLGSGACGDGARGEHRPSQGLSSVVVGAPQIPRTGSGVVRDLAIYSAARLALVAVLTVLLVVAGVPLLVAILLAVVVALPLSMVLLSSLRARVNAGLAVVRERRQAERERLRQQLRGDES